MTADATDADDPDTDNAAVRYSILEQGAGGMFSINATTGEICTAQPGLDREVAGTGGTRVTPQLGAIRAPWVVKTELQPQTDPGVGWPAAGGPLGS